MAIRKPRTKPNITTAASALREIIWSTSEGQLLGSEEDLTAMLGVSRPTVRQVARLLEREGLLKVRRGVNGGYFASRPSVEVIESAVSAYLEMVDADAEELAEIASSLWAIVVGKTAAFQHPDKLTLLEGWQGKVRRLKDDAGFDDMLALDEGSRRDVFRLIKSPYIELIFHINRTSAQRKYPFTPGDRDGTPEHREFIQAWRRAKVLELEAMAAGDRPVAQLAARHARSLFHRRLWGHDFLS